MNTRTFLAVVVLMILSSTVNAQSVQGDHDGDGKSDILWRNGITGQNWVYLMNGASISSSTGVNTNADLNWKIVGNGDFDGDLKADILWRNAATGQNRMYLMNGASILSIVDINTVADTRWRVEGIGDFDGDGTADILWRNSATGQNWMYLMNGSVIVSSVEVNTVPNPNWRIATTADFNDDGNADILWRNAETGQNWLYLMDGASVLSSLGINTVPNPDWEIVGSGDFNGDSNADIFWRNSSTGQNWMYLMNGATVLSSVGVNTVADSRWSVVGIGDYSGDGRAGVLWRNSVTKQNWMYLMNGASITSSAGINNVASPWEIVPSDDATHVGDMEFAQRAYIKSSSANMPAFGNSIAMDGETLVIGTTNDDAVFIFVRDASGTWFQQAYLQGSNTESGDGFGFSVALDGDSLAVGAETEDGGDALGVDPESNSAPDSGAVYIFTRDGFGVWSEQARLKGPDPEPGDRFGWSVAISDETVAIGARYEDSAASGVDGDFLDNSASNSGAVHLYTRDGNGTWSRQAFVKSLVTDVNDDFGWSLTLQGDTLVVGTPWEDSGATGINGNANDNSASSSGAVYAFERDGAGTWSQQAYIKASDTSNGFVFGGSVAFDNGTLVVGSHQGAISFANEDDPPGATYVFIKDVSRSWSQQAVLHSPSPDPKDLFGYAVAIDGDTLVVGASREASNATGINGSQLDNSADDSGAAYVFSRDEAGVWSHTKYIKASNTDVGDNFGNSVAISGDIVAVGAYSEDSGATGLNGNQSDNSVPWSGAVYVFH